MTDKDTLAILKDLSPKQMKDLQAGFTVDQQKKLHFMDTKPWSWFYSDDKFWSTMVAFTEDYWDRTEKAKRKAADEAAAAERAWQEEVAAAIYESQRHYWATLTRITGYTGPDYRVRLVDGNGVPQPTAIRATDHMYRHAVDAELEHYIEEPPKAPRALVAV